MTLGMKGSFLTTEYLLIILFVYIPNCISFTFFKSSLEFIDISYWYI